MTNTRLHTLDYYPFGMQISERSATFTTNTYRYGFNGMEKDDEVSGEGNIYDYGFRIYNPRIARFLSSDPLSESYPWYTPYQFAGNSPIKYKDLDGLEGAVPSDPEYEDNGGVEDPVNMGKVIQNAFQNDFETYVKDPLKTTPVISQSTPEEYLGLLLKPSESSEISQRAKVSAVVTQWVNETEKETWKYSTGIYTDSYQIVRSEDPPIPTNTTEDQSAIYPVFFIKTINTVMEIDPVTNKEIEVEYAKYLMISFQITLIPNT
jgi:RHS repeat-associated protein